MNDRPVSTSGAQFFPDVNWMQDKICMTTDYSTYIHTYIHTILSINTYCMYIKHKYYNLKGSYTSILGRDEFP